MISRFLRSRLDRESKRLIKNSSWLFISNLNSTACFFIRSIVLTRLLSADGFGLFILVSTYIKALLEITNLNLPTALTKFGAEFIDEDKSDRFIFLIRMFFIASVITILIGLGIFYLILNNYYEVYISRPGLQEHIFMYAAAIGIANLSGIFTSVLQLKSKFHFHAGLKIVQDWIELAVILWFFISDNSSLNDLFLFLSLAVAAHTVIYISSSLVFVRHKLPIISGKSRVLPGALIKQMISFVLINSPSNTILMGFRYIDTIALGLFAGNAQVGYYTIAKRLGYFVLRFTDPMTQSIYPQLSILVSKRKMSDLVGLIKNILKLGGVPMMIVVVAGILLGDEIITFLYGDDFHASYKSFVILLVSGVISAMCFWIQPLALSLGMVRERLIVNVLVLLYLLPASFYTSTMYGSTGMAMAMLSATVLSLYMLGRYVVAKLR